ncbi:unnamed protein product [Calypogeia fissa]
MDYIGGDGKKKAHLLFIPIHSQGHLIPGLRLVWELARKGITVTCAVCNGVLASLSSDPFLSELQSLDVQFIGLQDLRRINDTDDMPIVGPMLLQESFKPVFEKLVHDRSCGIAGPTCLLADVTLPWAKDVAEKLGIPLFMFIPSGATYAKLMQEYIVLMAQKIFNIEPDGTLCKYQGAIDINGVPSLHYHEVNLFARKDPAHFLSRSQVMCQGAGIVINTFYELEEEVIQAIVNPSPLSGFKDNKVMGKVYPVGPLVSTSPKLRSNVFVQELKDSGDESISWLDTQPPSSVLYVAFGTIAKLNAADISELALGLEGSDQRFLWVLPQREFSPEEKTSSILDVLPQGFQARVGDRGHIVTGWAPQQQILAHWAIAGFLTHAGWNSCLESITNGVPLICCPQRAEQALNCRYLVDVLKIAEQIHTGPENILDGKEVERAVKVLMVEPEGKDMQRRVEELQRKGAEAVAEDGSSTRMINKLAHDISACVSHDTKN